MHARVSTFTGDPSGIDQITAQARDVVLPAARGLAGFKGMLAMGDRATGKVVAITFWESEQAMADSEEAANRLRADAAQAGGEEIVGVERFEVVIDER
jgi:heme-degrading monooxygenase HmoA